MRKIGGRQWFNLNSMLPGPELVSDTFLALFLAQLQDESGAASDPSGRKGRDEMMMAAEYSVFVVGGDLPPCEADPIIAADPVLPSADKKFPPPLRAPWNEP